VHSPVVRLKPREIYSPISHAKENAQVFLSSARWFAHFKECYSMTGVRPTGKVGSADQEVWEEF